MRASLWQEGDGGEEEEEDEDVEEGKEGETKVGVVVEVVEVAVHVACYLRLGGRDRNPLELSRPKFSAIFGYFGDHDDEGAEKVHPLRPTDCSGADLDDGGLLGSHIVLENVQYKLTSWVVMPRL